MVWKIFHYKKTTSTNDVALEQSSTAGGKFVIVAETQTAGRGRRGRVWHSLKGNLFFSAVIPYPIQQCGTLVMLCSLSVLQTIKALCPTAYVQLKWPNDILLNNAKVSGMLLEKGEKNFMIVGIGVNISQCPDKSQLLYPITSLADAGIKTDCNTFLNLFLHILDKNLATNNIFAIRQQWLENVKGLNKNIIVRQEKGSIKGIFLGIDEKANLLLNTENGLQKIMVGDVFYD
ncbi:MAG: biotin--[acetyl-CoA-carboxylase] ligase [Alphaproteobacteria bacterium]|nr:biotin--[acetyl-CoA-carboxylase] ligase [Alphaproteobacteria bacterium]